MYEFGFLAMLGLAVFVVVDAFDHALLRHYLPRFTRTLRGALALTLGVSVTWITDFSIAAAWGLGLRSGWMGPVVTGLLIGGMAIAWRETFNFVSSYARRSHDEAVEIESRTRTTAKPKAA